jgi:hypothetical protein
MPGTDRHAWAPSPAASKQRQPPGRLCQLVGWSPIRAAKKFLPYALAPAQQKSNLSKIASQPRLSPRLCHSRWLEIASWTKGLGKSANRVPFLTISARFQPEAPRRQQRPPVLSGDQGATRGLQRPACPPASRPRHRRQANLVLPTLKRPVSLPAPTPLCSATPRAPVSA